MVLYISCISSSTSSISSSTSLSTSSCSSPAYESTTCYSQPIPLRSHVSSDDLSSTLSSSVESLSSLKSTCSSRWSAEREAERAEKRHLLNGSLAKLRSNSNLPLRKHLLVFNTIKYLQRELDLLDDEELYCSLMSSPDDAMEVDERRWLAPTAQQAPQTAAEEPAPPVVEEREAPAVVCSSSTSRCSNSSSKNSSTVSAKPSEAMEVDLAQQPQEQKQFSSQPERQQSVGGRREKNIDSWSWTNSAATSCKRGYFDSAEDSLASSAWSWSSNSADWSSFGNLGFTPSYSASAGSGVSSSAFGNGRTIFDEDTWTPLSDFSDPFASCLSRFELQHLFPSQLLLQA